MALDISDPPQSWADAQWTESTGGVTYFAANGNTAENDRVYRSDPWGRRKLVWRGYSDGLANNACGGWNTSFWSIDNTVLYRYSVWINRHIKGTYGSTYFGLHGGIGSSNNQVDYLDTTSAGTNAYFWVSDNPPAEAEFTENTWYLLVAHVHPHGTDYGEQDYWLSDSGIWNMNGTLKANIDRDYAWGTANTHARHRSYMYYPLTSTNAEQWFIYPRCDKCDGTQPHLRQLLRDGRTYLCGGMLIQ